MPYAGQVAELKLGQFGLMYDMAQQSLPPNALIRCENVKFVNGTVERAEEFRPWSLGTSVYTTPNFTGEKPIGVKRYFPSPSIERQAVVTDTGNVYKYSTAYLRELVLPDPLQIADPAPNNLSINTMPIFVEGGNEVQGNPKKMFIFTGNSPVQVIENDTNVRRNMTTPALDWANSYPSFGFIYRNRMIAFGNASDRHRVYISRADNQDDFVGTGSSSISCFPGEGEGLTSGFMFKGRVFVFKKPYGVYALIDTDPDSGNWYFQKISSSFGVASGRAFFEATDDMYVLSSDGAIVSMTAAFRLGDIYSADLLSGLKTESIFRNVMRKQFLYNAFGAYLPKKKQGFFAFPSYMSPDGYCDSLVHIDFNSEQPKISWHRYKDTEFTSCTFFGNSYGEDQFLMPKLNFSSNSYVNSQLATTFPDFTYATPFRIQTPHLDLGVPANKIFDHVELEFESTVTYPLALDVYIDSKFSETILIQPYFGDVLGATIFGPETPAYSNPLFVLDESELAGRGTRVKMKRLTRRGQTISFVVRDGDTISSPYTGGANPDDDNGGLYPVKLCGIKIYFRVAGQDQKAQTN